jgi:hypothetical protein
VDRKLGLDGDDWSRSGSPAAAWDNMSGGPTTNWYRFDAIGVATTIVLAARGGSISSESAVVALDGIVERLCRYHGFNEWVEQKGPDPAREGYPPGWNGVLIPASEWGGYDSPGWAANGTQENGFEANPIEAQGAIYFKGFLNYVLGLRSLVAPQKDPDAPLEIVYDDNLVFVYSHSEINSILTRDFAEALTGRSQGLCCEIHKLWPL